VLGHELAHVVDADTRPGIQTWDESRKIVKAAFDAFGNRVLSNEIIKSVHSIAIMEYEKAERFADHRGYGIVENYRKSKEKE
jgi:hypothetical protein